MRRASLEVGWGSVGVPAGVCLIVDQSRICGRFELPASTQSHAGHRWEQGRRPMCVCVPCGVVGVRDMVLTCVCTAWGWVHTPLNASTWELWVGSRVRRAGDPWEVWRVGTRLRVWGHKRGGGGQARVWCVGVVWGGMCWGSCSKHQTRLLLSRDSSPGNQ